MTFVLDACAIIAYLRDEEGADVVESVLLGNNACVAHAVNVCEVYYDCLRRGGNAELVTSDHREFDPIAAQGICPIRFIR